jgi:hypothetical protein
MYTKDLTDSGQAVNRYPWYLKPYEIFMIVTCTPSYTLSRLVAPFLNKLPETENKVSAILAPEINRRKALREEYGKDYPDMPVRIENYVLRASQELKPTFQNDFLEWMIDYAFGDPNLDSVFKVTFDHFHRDHNLIQVSADTTRSQNQFRSYSYIIFSKQSASQAILALMRSILDLDALLVHSRSTPGMDSAPSRGD